MREGRIGLTTRKGFLDYENLDVESYRRERLKAFVAMLGFLGLTRAPVLPRAACVPDAVQRERAHGHLISYGGCDARSGAPLIRDRHSSERSCAGASCGPGSAAHHEQRTRAARTRV